MAKTLKVIVPFMGLEEGDVFEFDGKFYVAQQNEDYLEHDGDIDTFQASFNARCTLSESYAKSLIEQGYLADVEDKAEKTQFVNVFDEIDNLIEKYNDSLSSIDDNTPPALKVEQITVYSNMIKVLEHLKSLRK